LFVSAGSGKGQTDPHLLRIAMEMTALPSLPYGIENLPGGWIAWRIQENACPYPDMV
jgi:hypothetical protein